MPTDLSLVTHDSETPDGFFNLPGVLRDGCLITFAALARGLDLVFYPRQVMTSPSLDPDDEGGPNRMSFVHGVPQSSTLSGVTFAQDKRIRRALLERAGIRVATGATFSYRGPKDVIRYANRVGYPLALKEAVGENLTEQILGIMSEEELIEAIATLRRRQAARENSASSSERSAYSLTSLLEPVEGEDGLKLAALSTRYLLEREPVGHYLRFLVLGGEVKAVLHFPGGAPSLLTGQDAYVQEPAHLATIGIAEPATSESEAPATQDPLLVHPALADIALRATAAVPGLHLAVVDITSKVVDTAPTERQYAVSELSERPRLDVFHAVDPGTAARLAGDIVAYEAARAERETAPVSEHVSVRLRFESVPGHASFLPAFTERMNAFGLEGSTEVIDSAGGIVGATITGPTLSVAVLCECGMGGLIDGQFPRLLEVKHS